MVDARTMKYGVDVSGCFMAWAGVMPLALGAHEILVSDKLQVLIARVQVFLCVFRVTAARTVDEVSHYAILIFNARGVR